MIKFKCPHCGKDVSAGDEHAGKKGRCPGCKELFVIPGGAAAKPVPAAERRTPPPPADDEEDAPPKKKKPADYDTDDPDAVEELKRRVGAKIVKRRPDEDDEGIAEAPRQKKPARDDEDDEAIAEAPRKKQMARDDDDEDDRPAKKKRGRDDDEDDEPRARKKRGRDDDDEDDDDRPRKKLKKRKGKYADCPNCGCRGYADLVGFTWWGGILGPRLFTHVRCSRCGTCYNGKTGEYNTTKIAIYVGVSSFIGIFLLILWIVARSRS